MATVTGTFGFAILLPLMKLVGVYYAACLFHIVIVFVGFFIS